MTQSRSTHKILASSLFVVSLCLASPAFAESVGHYIDDATITAKVKEAIFTDPALKVLQVKVNTLQGVVSLSGSVDTISQIAEAEKVTNQITGVTAITNYLAIKSAAIE